MSVSNTQRIQFMRNLNMDKDETDSQNTLNQFGDQDPSQFREINDSGFTIHKKKKQLQNNTVARSVFSDRPQLSPTNARQGKSKAKQTNAKSVLMTQREGSFGKEIAESTSGIVNSMIEVQKKSSGKKLGGSMFGGNSQI